MGINLRGTFHCTQLLCRPMMERRCGKIVNIASNSWAGEAMHAHCSVATQLAPFDINVNAVAPGGTRRSDRIEEQLATGGATAARQATAAGPTCRSPCRRWPPPARWDG